MTYAVTVNENFLKHVMTEVKVMDLVAEQIVNLL